ncbi:MAG: sodium-dependent transporter [Planctomycetes bacterium]|nr:sodium-dependent transporter [Planctomycetota bacterium]MBU1518478.1 sodium-dependent transporter [Planctomycetota bacterium]MBU2457417.1 sodium-dependent transporter [Planctomycetota bacterium]MBU2596623.1 sodium-dependent transporter [Planctomycetota bacterium]
MELLEEQRENWGSRGGFILAAIGSAVGLGNLWGFPYKLYNYGGGAFLIPYIIAICLVGIPMLTLEFSLGHFTQRAAPDAFRRCNRKLEMVGWWGIILGFVIITYYPVILAYCFSFLWFSIKGIFTGGALPWAGKGIEGVKNAESFFYNSYLGYHESFSLGSIRWQVFWPLVIAWLAMYFCIFRGVKLVSKIVWLTVPLPWLMLLILTVRGLTLDGAIQGLAFYLNPTWTELAKPTTWRFAFGQVFFSLSLAFGVMLTYASFLHRKSDINNNAVIIGLSDFATSFIAGIAVFATLGGMAFATQQTGNPVAVENVVAGGPGLAFVAFPYALAQLPYSAWFSFIFFFALITLGIDSAFSITESILASIVDKTGFKRSIVLILMSLVGLAFGLVYVTNGGLNWLGVIDSFVNGTWGIAFLGLLECVVLGWLYRIDRLRLHANERSDFALGRWWNYLIRIVIPIILGTLFVWSLFDDFTSGGFLFKQGRINWPNCLGLLVMAIAPIIAIALSLLKSPFPQYNAAPKPLEPKGRKSSLAGLIISLISSALIIVLLTVPLPVAICEMFLVLIILSAIGGILSANYMLDRFQTPDSKVSIIAPVTGILSICNISVALATVLIYVAKNVSPSAVITHTDELSGVSYIILSVVFLIIVAGLGWCFYKAMTAASVSAESAPQTPEDQIV